MAVFRSHNIYIDTERSGFYRENSEMKYEIIILAVITLIVLIVSFVKDRKKTLRGLKKGVKKFMTILIPLIIIVFSVSFVLYLIPEKLISKYLSGGDKYIQLFAASFLGSITLMPGFIAFPLAGILKQNNVPFMVISGFTSTLMMVGILTFPVERKYFGMKVAVLRNSFSYVIAIIVSLVTGLVFGEIWV
jgi:uncharacterized membrane protein YraQ (UPF0718 family)